MAKQHLIFNYFEIYGTIRLNLAYGTDQKKKKTVIIEISETLKHV